MVKIRSLATSLNDEFVFLFSVQKLLFVQDFRSFSSRDTFKCFLCGVLSRLTLIFFFFATKPFGFSVLAATENESAESFDTNQHYNSTRRNSGDFSRETGVSRQHIFFFQ